MNYIRRAGERGSANFGWLNSRHSFSFGRYYDPEHMGVSVLRVINDDIVQPTYGFDTHSHKDMEIISYVIEGQLEHKDSTGNHHIIPAGDIQLMSAGTGIRHSEFNPSKSKAARFLQIWIEPNQRGVEPGYQQKTITQQGVLTPLANENGDNGALKVHQDMSLSRLRLAAGETYRLTASDRVGYLHLIRGTMQVNENVFTAGDAFAVDGVQELPIRATEPLEALWFDLPFSG